MVMSVSLFSGAAGGRALLGHGWDADGTGKCCGFGRVLNVLSVRTRVLPPFEDVARPRADESQAEPIGQSDSGVLGMGSDPDMTGLAAGEKPVRVDEVVPDGEAAAADLDDLGDQVELVIHGHRTTIIAVRVDDRCGPSFAQEP